MHFRATVIYCIAHIKPQSHHKKLKFDSHPVYNFDVLGLTTQSNFDLLDKSCRDDASFLTERADEPLGVDLSSHGHNVPL